MRFGLPPALLVTLALTVIPSRAVAKPSPQSEKASPPTVARMIFDNIDYYVDIEMTFTPDEHGITVRWKEGKTVIEKHFDPEVRAELAKKWGSPTFSTTIFPADKACYGIERRWQLSRGGDARTICRNERAMKRLAEVQSILQLLMRD